MSTKYELVNVLDASYIKDKTAREHLQTIAKYGYWGTKEGIGSLAEVNPKRTAVPDTKPIWITPQRKKHRMLQSPRRSR